MQKKTILHRVAKAEGATHKVEWGNAMKKRRMGVWEEQENVPRPWKRHSRWGGETGQEKGF